VRKEIQNKQKRAKKKGAEMKSKSLKVKVGEIFKDNLDVRFNPDNAVKVEGIDKFQINVECSLCCAYPNYTTCTFRTSKCPFKRFETRYVSGCLRWIRLVTRIPYNSRKFRIWSDGIRWNSSNDKEARQQLSLLRRRAEKLITWV